MLRVLLARSPSTIALNPCFSETGATWQSPQSSVEKDAVCLCHQALVSGSRRQFKKKKKKEFQEFGKYSNLHVSSVGQILAIKFFRDSLQDVLAQHASLSPPLARAPFLGVILGYIHTVSCVRQCLCKELSLKPPKCKNCLSPGDAVTQELLRVALPPLPPLVSPGSWWQKTCLPPVLPSITSGQGDRMGCPKMPEEGRCWLPRQGTVPCRIPA